MADFSFEINPEVYAYGHSLQIDREMGDVTSVLLRVRGIGDGPRYTLEEAFEKGLLIRVIPSPV